MNYIIYKITNNVNSKIYIGFTSRNINLRFREHISESIKERTNMPIHRAIKKYGIEHFTIISIYESNNENETLLKETYFIKKYNTQKNGYNISDGGISPIIPEEIKQKWKGRKAWNKGIPRSKETIEKIKKTKKENPYIITKEHRKKLSENHSNYWLGHKHSKESKQKMSKWKKENYKANKNPNAKKYCITSPSQNIYIIEGTLEQFCSINNLNVNVFYRMIRDNYIPTARSKHYGWNIEKLTH